MPGCCTNLKKRISRPGKERKKETPMPVMRLKLNSYICKKRYGNSSGENKNQH
jgi:hypothetical protein